MNIQEAVPLSSNNRHLVINTLLAGIILILGIYLRLIALDWGLPDRTHRWSYRTDESSYLLMLKEMNPLHGDFISESFGPKIGSGILWPYGALILIAHSTGILEAHSSLEWYRQNPGELGKIYFVGRLLVAFMGIFTVVMTFILAKRAFGIESAYWSSALLAVAAGHVQNSHFLLADVPAACIVICSIILLDMALSNPEKMRSFSFFVGATFAYAVAIKVTVSVMGIAILGVMFAKNKINITFKQIWIPAVIGFLLALPIFHLALLDINLINRDVTIVENLNKHAYTSLSQMCKVASDGLVWSISPIGIFLWIIGAATVLWHRHRLGIIFVLASFPIAVVMMATGLNQMQRWSPLLPFICLLAPAPLQWFSKRSALILRSFLFAMLIINFLWSMAWVEELKQYPIHSESRDWIHSHLPAGTSIGVAQWLFLPQIDVNRYHIIRITGPQADKVFTEPEYFLVGEYDFEGVKAKLEDFEIYNIWRRTPQFLGLSYSPPIGADARFICPTIYLFKRK